MWKLACFVSLVVCSVVSAEIAEVGSRKTNVGLQQTNFEYTQGQWWGKGERPAVEDDSVNRFKIDVPRSEIRALEQRLRRSRVPRDFPADDWEHGVDFDYMDELVRYWIRDYDWERTERRLNRNMPQYTTTIDGLKIHFAHVLSDDPNAIPLIMSHGWPSSFAEFEDIVPLLTNPAEGEQAFHVVAPSLPGFGFSSQAEMLGLNHVQVGDLFSKLMARLGYDQYVAHGGDWGVMVSASIGLVDPDHCIGVHITMPLAIATDDFIASLDLTDYEIERMANQTNIWDNRGFSHEQATKPHTLGMALADSPIGLAAWLVEKFHAWTDDDFRNGFGTDEVKDHLLTNIMIYWVSNSITSSIRFYRENTFEPDAMESVTNPEAIIAFLTPISQPTGLALFPAEIVWVPQVIAELRFPNIVSWTDYPTGGHFPAHEEPEFLSDDIRNFVALALDF